MDDENKIFILIIAMFVALFGVLVSAEIILGWQNVPQPLVICCILVVIVGYVICKIWQIKS